ncbi:unnamed protein product [Zymoseptoria tritici ST99CH_3D1]|nr:unnamed protein product [Zymoseptoria tritici ST99CH_3D1]
MQFKNFFLAAAIAALTSAQDVPTLAAALNSTESLSSLNTLLGQYPDLLATLAGLTNTSIFAPSNEALETLMAQDGFAELAATDGYIEALLTYHVVPAQLASANITATPAFVPTLLNDTTYSNVTGGQVIGLVLSGEGDNATAQVISGLAQRSNITTADVEVSTGYVHIIDSVLTLPVNITSTLTAANLTGLAGAVIFADLGDTLDSSEDVTVFAPTTEAFEAIASALENATAETVASILQYHVAPQIGYSSLLQNGSQLETLAGSNVNVTILDGEVFVNSAKVIATDILVSGGVVHLIDAVLNPNSTNVPNAEEDQSPSNFEGATAGDVDEITNLVSTTATSVISPPPATPAPEGGAGGAGAGAGTSTSEDSASMPTGAMGAAALFGGMAILAQL